MKWTHLAGPACALFGGMIGAYFVLMVAPPYRPSADAGVIRTQRIELVDSTGVIRAVLAVDKAGKCALEFLHPNGQALVELGVWEQSQSQFLLFRGPTGRLRAGLTTDDQGLPALNMGDQEREAKVLLGPMPQDAGGVHPGLWGLWFLRQGSLSQWSGIGVGKDDRGRVGGWVFVVGTDGKKWAMPK